MSTDAIRALRRAGRHDEARDLAVELASQAPDDAELQFEAAWVHDFVGQEAEAVPYYLSALSGNLRPELLRRAYLGLGSTYRTIGKFAEAERVLTEGLARFPDANEMKVFLAMVSHNLGRSKQAVEMLLSLLAETSADQNIQSYREAIAFYTHDIDAATSS